MNYSFYLLKKIILNTAFIFIYQFAFSQTNKNTNNKEIVKKDLDSISKKSNPIIFADINFGYAYFSEHAFSGGLSLNYQNKSNFYKFRFVQHEYYQKVKFISIIPITKTSVLYNEYSLMYGKRIIKDEFSYHFTIGVSYNYLNFIQENNSISKNQFYGLPIEIGFLSFNKNKERYRLYGIIPVGKPTSFGRSTGIKIVANIAERSYIGLHLSIGLGYYKKY